MIELSKHIESLLLAHDCVIVPGLGGFVTQYVPARRDEDDGVFLPPCRSVGFNPQLTINDGLLVQSYMQAYDSNFPETVRLIDEAVAQLRETLQNDGEYELHGIGRLSLGMNGQYNFTPCEAGVVSPELYGLDAVAVAATEAESAKEGNHGKRRGRKHSSVKLRSSEKDYTISISREIVNYVAAAVVAVFFYALWATPIHSSQDGKQKASTIQEQLFASAGTSAHTPAAPAASPQPAAPAQQEAQAALTDTAQLQPETKQPQPETPVAPPAGTTAPDKAEKAQPAEAGGYTLVLASAVSEKNATNFVATLRADGLTEARTHLRGKMRRVVYGNFPDEAKARDTLHKLRETHSLPDVWIMKL